MSLRCNFIGAALGILAASVLSACATSTSQPATQAAVAAGKNTQVTEETLITGSRLPRKTTERLIRGADAKEMERDRPPNPGPQQN